MSSKDFAGGKEVVENEAVDVLVLPEEIVLVPVPLPIVKETGFPELEKAVTELGAEAGRLYEGGRVSTAVLIIGGCFSSLLAINARLSLLDDPEIIFWRRDTLRADDWLALGGGGPPVKDSPCMP